MKKFAPSLKTTIGCDRRSIHFTQLSKSPFRDLGLILFASLLLLPSSCCLSQITVGQSDMPNAGDTLRVSYSADTLNPEITDTNHTWDYSYLTPIAQWLYKFDSPSTFAPPFNLFFNVLNTSYGQEQFTPDSIPFIGITPDNAYSFFKESSANYKQLGAGLTINSLPIPFMYNPPDIIYKFPLNYGNRDSSDAEFGFNIPGIGYYGQKIHRVNVVDGWGTLLTPYGTFPSLRVKSLLSIRDTFADDTIGIGFAFNRPLVYEFKWLKQGGKIPYLQVNASDAGGITIVSKIAYRDSMRGVVQIGINAPKDKDFGLQVFPNPVDEYAFVQYTLDNPLDVKIDMLDIFGKKINTLRNSKQTSGTHLEIINLSNLNVQSGTYFLCLYAGEGKAVRKIVVMR